MVHAIELFGLADERTQLHAPGWPPPTRRWSIRTPAIGGLFADHADLESWLDDARTVIDGYFAIEQPQ